MNALGSVVGLLTLMVGVGMAATLVSPEAQTPKVLDSVFNGLTKFQGQNMGFAKS